MLSEENTVVMSPQSYQTDLNQYHSCKWSPNILMRTLEVGPTDQRPRGKERGIGKPLRANS
jgi:hypothetical protein